jgi:GGDEF domain-containing protein
MEQQAPSSADASLRRRSAAARGRRSRLLGDIVGRFAGDEFIALFIGYLNNGALEHFVDRIDRVRSEPIGIPGDSMQVGASIGVIRTHQDDPCDMQPRPRDTRASDFSKFTRAQS